MQLDTNEFTTNSLIIYLTKKFGKKISGYDFNHSDIAQYCMRGYLPFRYGGDKITIKHDSGIKIISLSQADNNYKYGKSVVKKENVKVKKAKKKKAA